MGETQAHVQIGHAIAQQYYQLFQQNREAVISLYHVSENCFFLLGFFKSCKCFFQPSAYLSFEGETKQGHTGIQQLLKDKLQFQTIAHQITAVDVQQLVGDNSGILVNVLGRLKVSTNILSIIKS